MDLNVKLQVFEGPLDLLLHLLEKNKVNIYDIPIAEITDQYLEYVALMRQEMTQTQEPETLNPDMQDTLQGQGISASGAHDAAAALDGHIAPESRVKAMDLMSEFMLMAATLLEIKARMLLPPDPDASEEEDDPRADLVARLLEYKMYKCMAAELKDRQIEASYTMYKEPTIPKEVLAYEEPVNLDDLFDGVTLARLNAIFQDVMKKQEQRVDPIRSKFGKIQKEEISLEQRTADLKAYAASHRKFSFRGLLKRENGKEEVIVTFLAILELMRTGTITITQESLFADICIESRIAQESS